VFGDVARVELGKALLPVWKKQNADLVGLSDYINRMTGVVSTKAQGVSATQRSFESGFLFFAPRYVRASAALVADILRGDLVGDEARSTIASMMVAGTATYIKAANALHQEPNLNPADSKFMTLQAGNDRVGIGSIWTSLARLAVRVGDDPASLLQASTDNPFLAWVRSRFPPATATLADIMSGRTYTGDKLEDWSDYVRYAAARSVPFSVASHALDEPRSQWSSLPAELTGFRVFPQSFTGQKDVLAKQRYGMAFAALPPTQQQEITQEIVARGYAPKGESSERRNSVFARYDADMEMYANRVATGAITKSQYRAARANTKAELSTRLQELEHEQNQGKSESQIDQEYRDRLEQLPARDAAREVYYHTLFTKTLTGEPDFDAANAYLASLPVEVQDYIDGTSAARLANLPPAARALEEEYRAVRAKVAPYFDVINTELKRLGLYEQWQNMSPSERQDFQSSRQYANISKRAAALKLNMRRRDRELDKVLADWYGRTPLSEQKQSQAKPIDYGANAFAKGTSAFAKSSLIPKSSLTSTNPLSRFVK
jgi:hypothetical protein